MFGKGRRKPQGGRHAGVEAAVRAEESPRPAEPAEPQVLDAGPYDIKDVGRDEERLDLGSLQIPPGHEVELRLEMDQQTGRVASVTAVLGESALQMVAFAAPRSSGIWRAIRDEIAESLEAQGTWPKYVEDGPFGQELVIPQGDGAMRLVGVDGPRWMVRGVFNGPAALGGPEAEQLEALFRSLVVVRGEEAMPPREQLPLNLPAGMGPQGQTVVEDNPERPPLVVPRRGPEITEIR